MIEILDQNCQTQAEQAALFVTSNGEVIREKDVLDCSSVNLNEIPEGVSVEAEFERKRQKDLNQEELQFVNHVYMVQDCVDFGRFRAYGQLNNDGTETIVVCTEFIGLVEDDELWNEIKETVEKTNAHYWVMSEEPNLEHSWKVYQDGPNKGHKIPNSDNYGPNHGKVERQVELSWQVQNLSVPYIKQLITKLKKQTESLWGKAGVGVC